MGYAYGWVPTDLFWSIATSRFEFAWGRSEVSIDGMCSLWIVLSINVSIDGMWILWIFLSINVSINGMGCLKGASLETKRSWDYKSPWDHGIRSLQLRS